MRCYIEEDLIVLKDAGDKVLIACLETRRKGLDRGGVQWLVN